MARGREMLWAVVLFLSMMTNIDNSAGQGGAVVDTTPQSSTSDPGNTDTATKLGYDGSTSTAPPQSSTNKFYVWTKHPEKYNSTGKRLKDHSFLVISGKRANTQCSLECLKRTPCLSYNFDQTAGTCELNNATHLTYPGDFVDSPTQEYHTRDAYSIDKEALGPCYGDPCNSRGRCLETRAAAGGLIPICLCDDGWKGTACDVHDPGPQWATWGDWSSCSVTCEKGWKLRTRVCEDSATQQTINPTLCYGAGQEYGVCELLSCPRWSPWGEWGDCSTQTTCGQGIQVRRRTCTNGGTIGVDRYCLGMSNQTTPCYGIACRGPISIINGTYPGEGRVEFYDDTNKNWSQICANQMTDYIANLICRQARWAGGHAAIKDARFGLGTGRFGLTSIKCNGTEKSFAECSHNALNATNGRCSDNSLVPGGVQCDVDGGWSLWSSWSDCSVSCENGARTRTRQCSEPRPMYGGLPCPGNDTESMVCSSPPCPTDGEWLQWGSWSQCSLTCGSGQQRRVRQCQQPLNGGAQCNGQGEETRICNQQSCPMDGAWSAWSNWSDCSVTCGNGSQSRTRSCSGPYYGGTPCQGAANETQLCRPKNCPVDGQWMDWENWSQCTVSCGGGMRVRHRECYLGLYGGKNCTGSGIEQSSCNDNQCPVDGKWLPWTEWESCSKSCGNGSQARYRECQGPFYGGANCTGLTKEERSCNIQNCSVDGVWLAWTSWSACSVSCGNGVQKRTRTCNGPFYGGKSCDGENNQTSQCFTGECPVPGIWFPWTSWTPCTVTCNGGTRFRTRRCNTTAYGDLTAPCIGAANQTAVCHTFACLPYAKTCSELGQRGLVDSTHCEIDPDGPEQFSLEPVVVYCNMTAHNGSGVTVIGHNQEQRTQVQGWEGACEYQAVLVYNVSFDHVVAIVDRSLYCEQFIKWECFAALIHNYNDNNKITTGWLNRTKGLADYFGGAPPGSNFCECGVTHSCAEYKYVCNCDSNDQVWRSDQGYLTYKDDLPVYAFVAGDTGGSDEEGYSTVGPLRCWGVN